MHLDDEQLLRAFAGGREDAFAELVERHGRAIKGYALRMLHSPQQAEDVYCETFLRVARERGRWEARGTVRGFLFTIAHRLCLDTLRQRKVAREAVPHLVEIAESRAPTPSPEAMAAMREQAVALEEALARLPPEHREVILLRVVQGLSSAEVGDVLGMTTDQVDSQLSYARKRLRVWMESARPSRRMGEA